MMTFISPLVKYAPGDLTDVHNYHPFWAVVNKSDTG